jgi:uncharacterized protein YjdB
MSLRPTAILGFVLVSIGLVTAACQDTIMTPPGTPTPVGTSVHSVTVSPGSATLNPGDRLALVAFVTADAGVTDRAVTWSSSNPAIASVDANGIVTAGGAAGNVTIIAKSKADPTIGGAALVTVMSGGPPPAVSVASYSVNLAVTNDPAQEERFTKYTSVKEVTVTINDKTVVVSGPSPWLTKTGTLNANNTFTATCLGTVAGNPNVQTSFAGTLAGNTISGTVVLGPGLPSNQTETLSLTGTKK